MSWRLVNTKAAQKYDPELSAAGLRDKGRALLDALQVDPFQTPPPYEKLVDDLAGAYSRRVNIQGSLAYQVIEDEHVIKVLRMWSHCD